MVVCTLFEGHYHYGVGALANSLYVNGFRGNIYVGYRGALPPWAIGERADKDDRTPKVIPMPPKCDYVDFSPVEGLTLRFVLLTTQVHLTNYKPNFMLDVWEKHCPEASGIFYFDPDIVVRCAWSYFEEWAMAGVALCEDINSPVLATHPLRAQWRRIYEQAGIIVDFKSDIYVNGGFQGINKRNRAFLEEWSRVQQVMEDKIGGLHKTGRDLGGREHPFGKTDQDALNITLGVTRIPVSLMGKEGMNLVPGGFTMSHTLGAHKAWNTFFILEALKGFPPVASAKDFYLYLEYPIKIFGKTRRIFRMLDIRLASLICRFYHRN